MDGKPPRISVGAPIPIKVQWRVSGDEMTI